MVQLDYYLAICRWKFEPIVLAQGLLQIRLPLHALHSKLTPLITLSDEAQVEAARRTPSPTGPLAAFELLAPANGPKRTRSRAVESWQLHTTAPSKILPLAKDIKVRPRSPTSTLSNLQHRRDLIPAKMVRHGDSRITCNSIVLTSMAVVQRESQAWSTMGQEQRRPQEATR